MRDYNPKRYRARSSDDRDENTERLIDEKNAEIIRLTVATPY